MGSLKFMRWHLSLNMVIVLQKELLSHGVKFLFVSLIDSSVRHFLSKRWVGTLNEVRTGSAVRAFAALPEDLCWVSKTHMAARGL